GLDAVGVARLHGDRGAVLGLDRRGVGVAVAGVDPAVGAPGEGAGHAVGVLEAVALVGHGAAGGLAVAVGVGEGGGGRGAVEGGLGALARRARQGGQGQHADGDVEAVGEGGDLAGPAVGAEVLQDLYRVARLAAGRRREGVLDGVGDPEPAAVVEGEVDRLVDVRLGGDQLGVEAGRQVEGPALLGGGAGGGGGGGGGGVLPGVCPGRQGADRRGGGGGQGAAARGRGP